MASGPGDPGRASTRRPNPSPSFFPTPASQAGPSRCAQVATGTGLAVPPELPVYRHPSNNGLGRPDGAGPAPTNRGRPPALPNAEKPSTDSLTATVSVLGPSTSASEKRPFSRPPGRFSETSQFVNSSVSGMPDEIPGANMDTSEAPIDDGFTLVEGSRRRKRRKETDGYSSDSSCSSNNTVCSRERTAPPPRREKIPPIVVQGMAKWNSLLRTLKAQGLNFEAKFVGQLLHIMCLTADDFRAVQRYLSAANLTFHTFSLREERELKVTLRGLPHDTPKSEIIEELEELGFTPTEAIPLQRRDGVSRAPSNTFLIKFRRTGSWAKVWDLKHLLGVRITVGEFRPRRGLPQCFNCQRYGHSSVNCHLPPRCVKCGGPHSGRQCSTPQEDIPTCTNCGAKTHPASYKGCPAHKDALAARRRRNQSSNRDPSRSRPTQVRVPRTPATVGVNTTVAPTPIARPPVQEPRPEPVQETEALPPTPLPSKPAVSYAAVTRRANRPRRPRITNNKKPRHVTETDETEAESDYVPATPTVAAPGPKFPKPRQRAPTAATVTYDKPVVQPATPSQNTVSTAALVQWLATLIPIILGSAHMQPAELLAAVLSSLQTLIAPNGQAA